jgi:hypothetical protein
VTAAPAAPARTLPGWLRELARAGAAPAICAAVLLWLLITWVITVGGQTSRVQIQVTQAAIPARSFVSGRAAAAGSTATSGTYLTIHNPTSHPDELTGARSPAARRVTLTRPGGAPAATGFAVPAGGTLTLSPFGRDVRLAGLRSLRTGRTIPLTLVFRHAGQVTIHAEVTAPGAP